MEKYNIIVNKTFGKYTIAIADYEGKIPVLICVDDINKKQSCNLSFSEAVRTLLNIGPAFYATEPEIRISDWCKERCLSQEDSEEINTIKTLVGKLKDMSKKIKDLEESVV